MSSVHICEKPFDLRWRYSFSIANNGLTDAGIRAITALITGQISEHNRRLELAQEHAEYLRDEARRGEGLPSLDDALYRLRYDAPPNSFAFGYGGFRRPRPDGYIAYFAFPEDWAWDWLVTGKGEYVGTLPKRIGKYLHQQYSFKLSSEILSKIGNLAHEHSPKSLDYTFDLTDRLVGWDFGNYGDGGSCFGGDHAGALDMLEQHDGLGVRFYDAEGNGQARCWLVRDTPADNMAILFNGYGFKGNATLAIARALSAYLGVSYKKINLTNNGNSHGTLWFNGGESMQNDGHGLGDRGIGYVLGAADEIEHVTNHDFHWEEVDNVTCYECGCRLSEGEGRYSDITQNDYCESCYDELFSYCESCDSECWANDMHEVYHVTRYGNRSQYVCEECWHNAVTCDKCGDYWDSYGTQQLASGEYLCPDCVDQYAVTCEDCDELFYVRDVQDLDGHTYCDDCAQDHKPLPDYTVPDNQMSLPGWEL